MDNFRLFRASVKAQGLQMLCVELTFGDPSVPYQLRADDCDILLQRRTAARIAPQQHTAAAHRSSTPQRHTAASRRTQRARARAASWTSLILTLIIPTLTGTPHPRPVPWHPPAAARDLRVSP